MFFFSEGDSHVFVEVFSVLIVCVTMRLASGIGYY